MVFSVDQRLLLQAICRYFHEQAQWPTLDYLDRMLTAEQEDFNVMTVGAQLERFMYEGRYIPLRGWDPERSLSLPITTLYTCYIEGICPELGEDFAAFMQVVQLAVQKYRTRTNDTPEVTADELRERFSMSELMLRKVFDLVYRAYLTSGSGSRDIGPDQRVWWTFIVAREVREYRQAATIADFIRIRDRVREEQRQTYQPVDALTAAKEPSAAESMDSPGSETTTPLVDVSPSVKLQPISLFPSGPFTRNDRLCFVLMPFNEKLRPIYDEAIVPSATQCGLECVRADEIYMPGGIMQQIWQKLMTARLVVADLTEKNANVFYELGLAHTIGHHVILLTQDMNWVPFDLKQMRCIQYDQDEHGLKLLKQKLGQMLRTVVAETER